MDFRDILKHKAKDKKKIEEEDRDWPDLKPVCKYRIIIRYKIEIEIEIDKMLLHVLFYWYILVLLLWFSLRLF
jgi:hypothetical protein